MGNNNDYIHMQELEMLKEIERISTKHNINYYLAYGTAIGAIRDRGFIPWDTDVDIIVNIDEYEYLIEVLKNEISEKFCIRYYKFDEEMPLLFSRVVLAGDEGYLIHVDIFPMVGLPSDKLRQILIVKLARIVNGLYFFKKVNPKKYYVDRKFKIILSRLFKLISIPFPTWFLIYIKEKLENLYPINKSKFIFNLCGAYGRKEVIPKQWLGDPIYKEFEGIMLPLPKNFDEYLTHIYQDYMTPKQSDYV